MKQKGKKNWKIILTGVLVMGGFITAGAMILGQNQNKSGFQTVQVEKGDVQSVITTTGNLKLLNTVNINSQISGKIDKVLVDYNQKVKKGQILAVLDTTDLKLAMQSAEGNVENAQNQLEQAQKSFSNTMILFEQNFKSQDDLDTAENAYKSAKISLKSTRISLEKSKMDLSNAVITSPMKGVVIDKNAIEGQSVNINVSETALFVISSDLEQMQIYASVAESDISKVKAGQKVSFTVQTYSGKTFNGKVSQIHLEPTVSQNVVNYTVVVDVNNQGGLLFPGMTATLNLVVESHPSVLKVPNSVFKFKPTQNMLSKPPLPADKMPAPIDSGGKPPLNIPSNKGNQMANMSVLFKLGQDSNKLIPIPVKIGLNDGQYTEVSPIRSEDNDMLCEGLSVVSGKANQNSKTLSQQESTIMSFGGPMGGPPGPRP